MPDDDAQVQRWLAEDALLEPSAPTAVTTAPKPEDRAKWPEDALAYAAYLEAKLVIADKLGNDASKLIGPIQALVGPVKRLSDDIAEFQKIRKE